MPLVFFPPTFFKESRAPPPEVPITSLIQNLSGIADLQAKLPLGYSLLLIAISIAITVVGGLIPARKAAKKDPVIALRTE